MGAGRNWCTQGFSTTTGYIHGMTDHIENKNKFTRAQYLVEPKNYFSGLGQSVAQGALEFHGSFL